MSKRIKGITIEIDGETKGLDKALANVNKESTKLQRELKDVEKLLKFNPGNTELLAQKQKLLGDQVANTREKLDKLKAAQVEVNRAFENGEISEEQYRGFQREIAETEGKLKNFESQLESTQSKLDKMGDKFVGTGEKFKAVGSKLQDAGKTLSTAVTAPIVAMGGLAVKTAADFEAQISRVGAIAGASSKELDALRDSALELGASTSKSASEVAIAQESLAALGFTVDDILGAMPGVISAAEASGSDMALTAEVMASAINIFGLEASEATRVADILAQTANQSAADINDMGYALKYAGPVAANLGVSMEELSASIGIMTDAGLDGSSAGTALRAGLLALLKPSEENSKKMAAMGIEMEDANGKFVGIKGVIDQLNGSMEGMTDAQKTATLASLVGTEASSGFLALMSAGPAEIEKMTKALEDSGGASAETAEKMKDNLKGALEELGGAFETMQITIGTALAPAIEKLAAFLQRLITWFNELSPSGQRLSIIFAAIAAAVGPVLVVLGVMASAIGNILIVVGKVLPYLGKLRTAFTVIRTVMLALTGPIGIAIAIITALGVVIYQNWDQIAAKTSEWFTTLKSYFSTGWQAIKAATSTALASVKTFILSIWESIKSYFTTLFVVFRTLFTTGWNAIKTVTTTVFNAVKTFVMTVFNAIRTYFMTVLNVYKTIFTTAWNAIKTVTTTVFNAIKTVVTTVWNAIRTAITTVTTAIRTVVTNGWNLIRTSIANVLNGIRTTVTTIWNGIKTVITTVTTSIRTVAVTAFNTMRTGISTAINGIKTIASTVFNSVKSAIVNPIESAKETVIGIIEKIKSAFAKMSITIPKPKLPRVSVSMGSKEVGGISIPFPEFSVDWYKKGGVFGGPSIIGVGEEPGVSEAVIPLKPSVLSQIGRGIAEQMGTGAGGPVEVVVNLDGYTIARVTQPYIDQGQQSKTNMKSYMAGVKR